MTCRSVVVPNNCHILVWGQTNRLITISVFSRLQNSIVRDKLLYCSILGLAITLYIRCVYGHFGREVSKYKVILNQYQSPNKFFKRRYVSHQSPANNETKDVPFIVHMSMKAHISFSVCLFNNHGNILVHICNDLSYAPFQSMQIHIPFCSYHVQEHAAACHTPYVKTLSYPLRKNTVIPPA